MMSFSANMTGFFMNFELLPILTDYANSGLSDTILKGIHPGTIPARFGLIWFSGFRGEDLNVIFYQNMPNLHNRYIYRLKEKNPPFPTAPPSIQDGCCYLK
jgi:hypothetical protein